MPDLDDTIETIAEGPAEVSGDAGTVKQQPLPDVIAADEYLSGKTAAANRRRGLRFTKLIPPGAD